MTSRILEMASQSQGSGAVGEILPSNHSPTLEQMTEDFKRLISGMMVQLETMYNQVSKFQELHKQVSSSPELMDTAFPQLEPFSRSPDIPESVSGSAEKEAKQLPQDPKFKATPGPQPSTRSRFLSETEEQDSQPVWIKKPQFWQDSLTQELWKLFRNSYENHQGPSKERKDSGLSESELKPEPRHRNSLSDSELLGIFQKDISQLQYETQESSGRADSFLKPLSWDAEDTQHSWKKQDALLLQSDTVAVPQALQKVRVLKHRELVLAMTVSCFTRHVFTCSRSGIKVWNLMSQVAEDRFPESHLKCGFQAQKAYLRTCLLSSDSRTLFGGGHNLPGVSVWDLAAPSLYEKCQLPCTGLSCQALASTENNMAFGGFTDGRIRIWDLRSQGVIRDLEGPVSAIKSLMVRDDKIWTGGLDTCLRCWDLREAKVLLEYRTQSQIMSLSHSPTEDWLLLGLVSGQHCLFDTKRSQALTVGTKEKTILGLKFSQNGQWWVSVGMDGLTTIHSMPTGAKLLQAPEAASVSCCDMTEDGRLVFTGSKDCASVYQIKY